MSEPCDAVCLEYIFVYFKTMFAEVLKGLNCVIFLILVSHWGSNVWEAYIELELFLGFSSNPV
jgi:hypothetical protein